MFPLNQPRKINCQICGVELITTARNRKYCDKCKRIVKNEKNKKYRESEHGKAVIKAYYQSDHGKEVRRIYDKKWYKRRPGYKRALYLKMLEKRGDEFRERERIRLRKYYYENRELILLNRRIKYYDDCIKYWEDKNNE